MAYHPLKLDPAVVRHAALSLEAAQRLEDPMAAMETVEDLIRYLQRPAEPAATQPATAPVAAPEPAPPFRAITSEQRRRRSAGAARARARRAAGAGA